ncbi:hypothetical protein OTK49_21225 [Vibrio coralliirubri]|uniref:hypothetical protein n=1 Tax=Vibrio coralliirubri TaxID=1516159 RepID=UPI002283EC9F|nr:hypothetical protein [Vibrio coralliirubri]MCY9865043.1 hypothetical protein [Vibrio coralliirubri]
MENVIKTFAKNVLIAGVGQDVRIADHKNLINLVSVCLDSSLKGAAELTKEAVASLGDAELVASTIFNFNFQKAMFKGTRLLRDSTYEFSDEWRLANEQQYVGLTVIFDLMEIEITSSEAQLLMEEIKFALNQKIMAHLIFN